MDIRNWEFYEDGNALVGATVKVRDAILTHPNAGTILATTTTDNNGAWAFTGLTDTAKDVEVIWGNVGQYHRWYKGTSRHDLGVLFNDEPMEFKQVASLAVAAGAGASLFGFKTDGEPIFRSGGAGAETKIATYTGATGVLKAGGWGTIGSAEITDGSIATIDVAANAITQNQHAVPANTSGQTTTSTTPVAIGDMSVTLTATGGDVFLDFSIILYHNTAAATGFLALYRDGSFIATTTRQLTFPVVNARVSVAYKYKITAESAGSHTYEARWWTTSGTLTADQDMRALTAFEFKR